MFKIKAFTVVILLFLTACSSIDRIFEEPPDAKPPSNITLLEQNSIFLKASFTWESNSYNAKQRLYFKKLRAENWSITSNPELDYGEAKWLDTNSTYLVFARNFNKDNHYKDTDTIEIKTIKPVFLISLGNTKIDIGRQEGEADERPVWSDTIPKLFVSTTETPQLLWKEFSSIDKLYTCDSCPANRVSWFEAILFANEISKFYGLDSVYTYTEIKYSETDDIILESIEFLDSKIGFRLPLESEWEYFAEGNAGNVIWSDSNELSKEAIWNTTEVNKVASKESNSLGLYDIYGNVWEWVFDGHNDYPNYPVDRYYSRNPEFKVQRGASFRESQINYFSSTNRAFLVPTYSNVTSGFRLVINNPL
jgi:formylglycine-generating enzyme required for sulfatase activity